MNTNNGWLDIASAPKDGSRVLLWNRHFDAPCSGQFYGFGDWRMDGNLPPFVYQPTHWMPLPAAPGSPASTVADEGSGMSPYCPECNGGGRISVLSDNSPDAHDVDIDCTHCGGSGSAVDAATTLARALQSERMQHLQIYAEYKNFHRSLCARFGYGHDPVYFRRDLVSLEEAIAAKVSAPAAGDALDAKRYQAWRDQMITGNQEFRQAIAAALPKEVGDIRPPTAAEWDAAIDAAISASQQGGE